MVVDLSPSSAKASAPTQPKFADSGVTSGHRIFTMIAPDGTTTFTPSYYNTTEHSNLNATKGFRIKCYNSLTTEGVRFNPSTSDFTNYHYFVLVYSDSATQHHFAKITEIMTEDVDGDAIEFTPKLGNEIPKGTKFLIIKGPHKTNQSDIAAFSAGIKDDLKSDIHCARPLFYMFDENLDKKGELNHNTKYYCRQQTSNLITNPSAFNTTNAVTFRTNQDFGSVVIDYSKFSHSVTMTDKLQALDNTISGSITKNEGGTVTADTNDYNEMFPNARRIADDEVNSPVYSGPTRYLHYDHSPTKANLVAGIYEHNNTESMDGKGGFSETSILDSARILSKKIQEFYPYRVRHNIHRGNLEDFIALKATYASTNSTNSFAFNTEYDLGSVLNAGDEVKIDDSILIVDSFGGLSGGVQSVAFRAEVRAVSDGVFASATVTPSSGATLQRRAYNTQDGTLMIDLDLIGDRFSKMYVALSSLNQNGRFATVTACDDVKGMLTLSMSDDSYYGKTLSFATGNYLLFIERFNGEVENIESKKEEGQTVMTIQGRDKFNKLLSPVVNLNTLFSEDIIYSSNSPYNKLGSIKSGTNLSVALGDIYVDTGITASVSSFDNYPVVGTKLFTVNGYLGEVVDLLLHATVNRRLEITPAATAANTEEIYMETEKNYILNKSLSSSQYNILNPTSLTGSANKGIIFTSGNKVKTVSATATTAGNTTVTLSDTSQLEAGMVISGHSGIPTYTTIVSVNNSTQITISATATTSTAETTTFVGGEDTSLVSSSANINEGAVGYAINSPSSISNDSAFQAKLHDEYGSASAATFDTVNTLIDFEIVSINNKENSSEITIAPYIPITLGRKIPNYKNSDSYTLTELEDLQRSGGSGGHNSQYNNILEASGDGAKALDIGDAVFAGTSAATAVFVGYVRVLRFNRGTSSSDNLIYLDRDYIHSADDKVFSVSKDTHDLYFINGAHLWNSKILSLPHPKLTALGAVPLNHSNPYALDVTDINKKHGQPYYRLMSMSKGGFNITRGKLKAYSNINEIYENNSKLKYSSIAYKFKPNIATTNLTAYDATGTGDDIHMDYDMRGFNSVYGSLFAGDSRIRRNAGNENKYPIVYTSNLPDIEGLISSFSQKNTASSTLFLYINSDVLPYSSLRKDSLMDGNKNVNYYNLLLLQDKEVIDGELGYSDTTSSKRKTLPNNSFQQISFSTQTDISTIKRFGLMRLTEVCFDIHFNTFNPEKETVKDSNFINIESIHGYTFTDIGAAIDVSASLAADNDEIKLAASPSTSPSNGDHLYDSNYLYLGQVFSYSHPTITLDADSYLNTDATFTAGNLFIQATDTTIKLFGSKDQNTFMNTDRVHLQKGAIVTDKYQESTSDNWYSNNSNNALSQLTITDNIVTPIRFNYPNAAATLTTARILPSRAFYQYFASSGNIFSQTVAVILKTYDIEEGNSVPFETGVTVPIRTDDIKTFTDSTNKTSFLTIGTGNKVLDYKFPDETSNTLATSAPYEATGIHLGFKARLFYDASEHETVVTTKSSSGNLFRYGLNIFGEKLGWMDFIDITGHYLVSENGYDTILKDAVSTGDENIDTGRTMDKVIPEEIIYVVSHEVTNSNSGTVKNSAGSTVSLGNRHVLITDKALTDETAYRILKPNETTFYDKSPKEITLNMLSQGYTKMPDDNKMYNVSQDFDVLEGTIGRSSTKTGPRREAFLSMYVAIDADKQSSSEDYLVMRKAQNFLDVLSEGDHSLYMSDGEVGYQSSLTVTDNKDYSGEKEVVIAFSKLKEQDGIVSVSEPFTVSTVEKLSITPTRACIGSTVSIGLEGEDLINELLEEEGIEFEVALDANKTPMYLAPNYQGVDLFSAIRYVLDRKEMKLVEENNVFKIAPDDDNDYYTGITIDDSGDFLIFEFEKVSTLFDFYNEINVYGNAHKATRKDIRSIQKRGRKTLEVVDGSLLTQQEVDKKALKLLRMHSTLNQKLTITLNSKGISQLRVGDIVNVSIPRENIEMSQYIVLEMGHELTGFITLQLGRYSKDLSDVFSELLISSKETKAALRNQDLTTNSFGFDFLESVKIKELKLLIRTRTASGGFLFGFTTALNTATTAFGSGGAISHTTLLDEDLV